MCTRMGGLITTDCNVFYLHDVGTIRRRAIHLFLRSAQQYENSDEATHLTDVGTYRRSASDTTVLPMHTSSVVCNLGATCFFIQHHEHENSA